MKDRLYRDIAEDQLVAQINKQTTSLAVVRGGLTRTQVRVVDLSLGIKGNCSSNNLVIISPDQAIELAQGIIEKVERQILAMDEPSDFAAEARHTYYKNKSHNLNRQVENLTACIGILRRGGNGKSIIFRTEPRDDG